MQSVRRSVILIFLCGLHAGVAVPARAAGAYRHPTGAGFRFPEGRSAQELPGFVRLIPPGNAEGAEFYFVRVESAGDVARADDPRAIQGLEALMQSLAPVLRRTGQVEPLAIGTEPGVALAWEGVSADGVAGRARAFALVSRGLVVALVGLGLKERILAREAALGQIAATFQAGEGERDPRLAGIWQRVHNARSEPVLGQVLLGGGGSTPGRRPRRHGGSSGGRRGRRRSQQRLPPMPRSSPDRA